MAYFVLFLASGEFLGDACEFFDILLKDVFLTLLDQGLTLLGEFSVSWVFRDLWERLFLGCCKGLGKFGDIGWVKWGLVGQRRRYTEWLRQRCRVRISGVELG